MTVRRIRQSEIKAFKLCRRNWWWSYRSGMVPIVEEGAPPSTADVGTIVHAALDAYYTDSADPLATIQTFLPEDPTDAWLSAVELSSIMVEGYLEWLAETGADADYRVLEVERQIEVPFGELAGDEVIVTGRLDLLVEHVPTGLIYLRDHKTVQSLDQTGRQLQIDEQLLTYTTLLRMVDGVRVTGAEHNELRRVKRTAAAKPPFYGRPQVPFNDTQLRNHYRHMIGTLTEMVRVCQSLEIDETLHHDVAPPTVTSTCSWRCRAPGLDLCLLIDDGSGADAYVRDMFVNIT